MKEQFENDVTFEFSTPTVKVIKYYPKEGLHSPNPICFLGFDQFVDIEVTITKK